MVTDTRAGGLAPSRSPARLLPAALLPAARLPAARPPAAGIEPAALAAGEAPLGVIAVLAGRPAGEHAARQSVAARPMIAPNFRTLKTTPDGVASFTLA
jgi:hypothetical protein